MSANAVAELVNEPNGGPNAVTATLVATVGNVNYNIYQTFHQCHIGMSFEQQKYFETYVGHKNVVFNKTQIRSHPVVRAASRYLLELGNSKFSKNQKILLMGSTLEEFDNITNLVPNSHIVAHIGKSDHRDPVRIMKSRNHIRSLPLVTPVQAQYLAVAIHDDDLVRQSINFVCANRYDEIPLNGYDTAIAIDSLYDFSAEKMILFMLKHKLFYIYVIHHVAYELKDNAEVKNPIFGTLFRKESLGKISMTFNDGSIPYLNDWTSFKSWSRNNTTKNGYKLTQDPIYLKNGYGLFCCELTNTPLQSIRVTFPNSDGLLIRIFNIVNLFEEGSFKFFLVNKLKFMNMVHYYMTIDTDVKKNTNYFRSSLSKVSIGSVTIEDRWDLMDEVDITIIEFAMLYASLKRNRLSADCKLIGNIITNSLGIPIFWVRLFKRIKTFMKKLLVTLGIREQPMLEFMEDTIAECRKKSFIIYRIGNFTRDYISNFDIIGDWVESASSLFSNMFFGGPNMYYKLLEKFNSNIGSKYGAVAFKLTEAFRKPSSAIIFGAGPGSLTNYLVEKTWKIYHVNYRGEYSHTNYDNLNLYNTNVQHLEIHINDYDLSCFYDKVKSINVDWVISDVFIEHDMIKNMQYVNYMIEFFQKIKSKHALIKLPMFFANYYRTRSFFNKISNCKIKIILPNDSKMKHHEVYLRLTKSKTPTGMTKFYNNFLVHVKDALIMQKNFEAYYNDHAPKLILKMREDLNLPFIEINKMTSSQRNLDYYLSDYKNELNGLPIKVYTTDVKYNDVLATISKILFERNMYINSPSDAAIKDSKIMRQYKNTIITLFLDNNRLSCDYNLMFAKYRINSMFSGLTKVKFDQHYENFKTKHYYIDVVNFVCELNDIHRRNIIKSQVKQLVTPNRTLIMGSTEVGKEIMKRKLRLTNARSNLPNYDHCYDLPGKSLTPEFKQFLSNYIDFPNKETMDFILKNNKFTLVQNYKKYYFYKKLYLSAYNVGSGDVNNMIEFCKDFGENSIGWDPNFRKTINVDGKFYTVDYNLILPTAEMYYYRHSMHHLTLNEFNLNMLVAKDCKADVIIHEYNCDSEAKYQYLVDIHQFYQYFEDTVQNCTYYSKDKIIEIMHGYGYEVSDTIEIEKPFINDVAMKFIYVGDQANLLINNLVPLENNNETSELSEMEEKSTTSEVGQDASDDTTDHTEVQTTKTNNLNIKVVDSSQVFADGVVEIYPCDSFGCRFIRKDGRLWKNKAPFGTIDYGQIVRIVVNTKNIEKFYIPCIIECVSKLKHNTLAFAIDCNTSQKEILVAVIKTVMQIKLDNQTLDFTLINDKIQDVYDIIDNIIGTNKIEPIKHEIIPAKTISEGNEFFKKQVVTSKQNIKMNGSTKETILFASADVPKYNQSNEVIMNIESQLNLYFVSILNDGHCFYKSISTLTIGYPDNYQLIQTRLRGPMMPDVNQCFDMADEMQIPVITHLQGVLKIKNVNKLNFGYLFIHDIYGYGHTDVLLYNNIDKTTFRDLHPYIRKPEKVVIPTKYSTFAIFEDKMTVKDKGDTIRVMVSTVKDNMYGGDDPTFKKSLDSIRYTRDSFEFIVIDGVAGAGKTNCILDFTRKNIESTVIVTPFKASAAEMRAALPNAFIKTYLRVFVNKEVEHDKRVFQATAIRHVVVDEVYRVPLFVLKLLANVFTASKFMFVGGKDQLPLSPEIFGELVENQTLLDVLGNKFFNEDNTSLLFLKVSRRFGPKVVALLKMKLNKMIYSSNANECATSVDKENYLGGITRLAFEKDTITSAMGGVILTVSAAQGLTTDTSIIHMGVNTHAHQGKDYMSRAMYVALTRAKHSIVVQNYPSSNIWDNYFSELENNTLDLRTRVGGYFIKPNVEKLTQLTGDYDLVKEFALSRKFDDGSSFRNYYPYKQFAHVANKNDLSIPLLHVYANENPLHINNKREALIFNSDGTAKVTIKISAMLPKEKEIETLSQADSGKRFYAASPKQTVETFVDRLKTAKQAELYVKQVLRTTDRWTYSRNLMKKFQKEFLDMGKMENLKNTQIVDKEVIEAWNNFTHAYNITPVEGELTFTKVQYSFNAFIKSQIKPKDLAAAFNNKAGQPLAGASKTLIAMYSTLVRVNDQMLFQCLQDKWKLAYGVTQEEIFSHFQKFNGFHFAMGDYHEYDANQTEFHKSLEMTAHMLVTPFTEETMSFYIISRGLTLFSRFFVALMGQSRPSGGLDTLSGNTLLNMLTTCAFYEDCNQISAGVFLGDDSLFLMKFRSATMRQGFYDVLWRKPMKMFYHAEVGEFCNYLYDFTTFCYNPHILLMKIMNKDFKNLIEDDAKWVEYFDGISQTINNYLKDPYNNNILCSKWFGNTKDYYDVLWKQMDAISQLQRSELIRLYYVKTDLNIGVGGLLNMETKNTTRRRWRNQPKKEVIVEEVKVKKPRKPKPDNKKIEKKVEKDLKRVVERNMLRAAPTKKPMNYSKRNIFAAFVTNPEFLIGTRYTDQYECTPTATASPYYDFNLPFSQTASDYIFFQFRDAVRSLVYYDANTNAYTYQYNAYFKAPNNSNTNPVPPASTTYFPNVNPVGDVYFNMAYFVSADTYSPHGSYLGVGLLSQYKGGMVYLTTNAVVRVSLNRPSADNLSGYMCADRYSEGAGLVPGTSLSNVITFATTASYTATINIVANGYYGFHWKTTTAGLAAATLNVSTLNFSGTNGVQCHVMLPGIVQNLTRIDEVRVLAASTLCSNVSANLYKEGNIAMWQIPSSKAWSEYTTYSSIAKQTGARFGRADKGAFGWLRPKQAEDFMFKDQVSSDDGILNYIQYDIDSPNEFLATAIYIQDNDVVAPSARTFKVHTNWGLEFRTGDLWTSTSMTKLKQRDMDEAMEILRTVPQFFDNPNHLSEIASHIWKGVKKYGPAVARMAKEYGPLVAKFLSSV